MQIGHVLVLHLALLLVVLAVHLVPLRGQTRMIPSLSMLQKRSEPGILAKSIGDLSTDMF